MTDHALSIHGLSKIYNNEVSALDNIYLKVKMGDFFALLGPNGAGKSTLIGIVTSLINKSAGKVRVMGYDIDTHFSQAKSKIGVVPQEFNFNNFEPLMEIVKSQAGYFGLNKGLALEATEDCLDKLGLWEKRKDTPRELSGGMKRRLMVARALVHNPKLLILDEPTAGVDIEIRRSMWELLQTINMAGKTIILTTHYLEEAENLCRNIAIINHGKIIVDTSMRNFLERLKEESFILYLRHPIQNPLNLQGYSYEVLDGRTLEVTLSNQKTLYELFSVLNQQGVAVLSIKNKTSRLEELFFTLIKNSSG